MPCVQSHRAYFITQISNLETKINLIVVYFQLENISTCWFCWEIQKKMSRNILCLQSINSFENKSSDLALSNATFWKQKDEENLLLDWSWIDFLKRYLVDLFPKPFATCFSPTKQKDLSCYWFILACPFLNDSKNKIGRLNQPSNKRFNATIR